MRKSRSAVDQAAPTPRVAPLRAPPWRACVEPLLGADDSESNVSNDNNDNHDDKGNNDDDDHNEGDHGDYISNP